MTSTRDPNTGLFGGAGDRLDLADYRRRVAESYASARRASDPEAAWITWRRERDELMATHRQSPLEPLRQRPGHRSPFAPYDPAFRISVHPKPRKGNDVLVVHSDGATTHFEEIASLEISLPTGGFELALYWLPVYGGGLFLPFRDGTAGRTTYGGGRYLLDTVKGADLGAVDRGLVLDFNFAYNPSCSYSEKWSCPLAPPTNHTDVEVPVGELHRP